MRNKYEVVAGNAIVYANYKGETVAFIFDLDVLEKMKEKDVTYSVNSNGYLYYYERFSDGTRKVYTIHRHFVFNELQPGQVVDHINRKRNDNRRSNLRIISASENNSKNYSSCRPPGKGYSKSNNLWEVRKSYNGKQLHFGYFKKEEDAAQFSRLLLKLWE